MLLNIVVPVELCIIENTIIIAIESTIAQKYPSFLVPNRVVISLNNNALITEKNICKGFLFFMISYPFR